MNKQLKIIQSKSSVIVNSINSGIEKITFLSLVFAVDIQEPDKPLNLSSKERKI